MQAVDKYAQSKRDYEARLRAEGRVPVKFWVEKDMARGYRAAWDVASKDQVGKVLETLVESGDLQRMIAELSE